MGGGISRFSNAMQGDLTGRTIRIHGKHYTFQRRLGAGAFGAVYAAQAPHGRNVAIKVVDLNRAGAGPTLSKSYLNEVQHLQKLRERTRHVVHIYDFDFDFGTGRAYIVMELGGDNLAKAIERSHATTRSTHQPGTYVDPILRQHAWKQMVTIVRTLTENNIVHMDLKPDNLILFGQTIKIADLGISKKADMLGEPGVGTPQFSAPEIMIDHGMHHQRYGPKADVWSLGAILYCMTYGRPPSYFGDPARPPPGQAPSRDHALVDMLHRTLVRDPHRRADIYTVSRHPFTNR